MDRLRRFFDPAVSGFLVRMLALQIILVCVLLFAANAAASDPKIAGMGQFGDVLGGISNFVTGIVVTISAVYATRQLKQFREEHSHEVKSGVALDVWRACFALAGAAQAAMKLASKGHGYSFQAENDRFWASFGESQLVMSEDVALNDTLTWISKWADTAEAIHEGARRTIQGTQIEPVDDQVEEFANWRRELLEHLHRRLTAHYMN